MDTNVFQQLEKTRTPERLFKMYGSYINMKYRHDRS